jgi:hypothetical protein
MFQSVILPCIGIAIATTVICYIIKASPLMEPFKTWGFWGVLAIGLLWALTYVLPLFNVSM